MLPRPASAVQGRAVRNRRAALVNGSSDVRVAGGAGVARGADFRFAAVVRARVTVAADGSGAADKATFGAPATSAGANAAEAGGTTRPADAVTAAATESNVASGGNESTGAPFLTPPRQRARVPRTSMCTYGQPPPSAVM